MAVLPDVLRSSLTVVFCGTAAGTKSAEVRAYYAGRGNKFWRTLSEIGLTTRMLAPCEFKTLPRHGIGLTDLAKGSSGPDAKVPRTQYDVAALRKKIERYRPAALAFNGKKAGAAFLGRKSRDVRCGRQEEVVGTTVIFVLPSTSGANGKCWDQIFWHELAAFVKARRS